MGVPPISIPANVTQALTNAGQRSGVDFDYLLQTAIRESSLDPQAKAATSSATGLFQFLDATWLQVMKEDGPRLGYGQYADAIARDGQGRYAVADPDLRAQILRLREDPQISADLAAAYTRNNGEMLQAHFGRMPSPGELYIAHFLGAEGAERMFEAGLENPDQVAADLFPRQATANRAIFFDEGQPRTIREVYQALVARHDAVAAPVDASFTAQQYASEMNTGVPPASGLPGFTPDDMSFTGLFSTMGAGGVSPLALPPDAATLPERPAPRALFTEMYRP